VANGDQIPQAQAIASLKLEELSTWLSSQLSKTTNLAERAHVKFAILKIEEFRNDPAKAKVIEYLRPPDGSPIGMFEEWCSN
jgi:hypothetical protein